MMPGGRGTGPNGCCCGLSNSFIVVQSVETVSGFFYLWLTVLDPLDGSIAAQLALNTINPTYPTVQTANTGNILAIWSGLFVFRNVATGNIEILAQNGKFYDRNLNYIRTMVPPNSIIFTGDPAGPYDYSTFDGVGLSFDPYFDINGIYKSPSMWINDANVGSDGKLYIVGGIPGGRQYGAAESLQYSHYAAFRYSADGQTEEAVYRVLSTLPFNSSNGFVLSGVAPDETVSPPGVYTSVTGGCGKLHWPSVANNSCGFWDWSGGSASEPCYAVRLMSPSQAAFARAGGLGTLGGIDFGGPSGAFGGPTAVTNIDCYDVDASRSGFLYAPCDNNQPLPPNERNAEKFDSGGNETWGFTIGFHATRVGVNVGQSNDMACVDGASPVGVVRLRDADGSTVWKQTNIPGTIYAVRWSPATLT